MMKESADFTQSEYAWLRNDRSLSPEFFSHLQYVALVGSHDCLINWDKICCRRLLHIAPFSGVMHLREHQ